MIGECRSVFLEKIVSGFGFGSSTSQTSGSMCESIESGVSVSSGIGEVGVAMRWGSLGQFKS